VVELQVTTHYSFLRGASSPKELFASAALLGHTALGVTDRNSLAGIVQAHDAAKATGCRLVVGCRLDLEDEGSSSLLVYPTDKAAYARLCRMLTLGKARVEKGKCRLHWSDVAEWSDGLVMVLLADQPDEQLRVDLRRLREIGGDRAYCALTRRYRPQDAARLVAVEELARACRVAAVATGDVLYHVPSRRILQDVVTAIRLKTTVDDLGHARERHAGRHLVSPQEAERLMAAHAQALARSDEIASRCRFSLDELTYTYPTEAGEDGQTPQDRLEALTWAGADQRYPDGLPDKVAAQLRHELTLIERMGYAPYFLTVDSIVRFARGQGILCQGRGSAANSAVCYVLGITSIDPVRQGLLFERFISTSRDEPPDIDVDFEHERREEVIQWVFSTYGHHRAALTATVNRYGARGAVREVGKALGVPEDVTGALASLVWGWSRDGVQEGHAKELNLNLDDRRLRLTLDLAQQLIDTPRHLGQHPGGFVLTLGRLDELCPIAPASMANRQTLEWDKIDIEVLKFMKVDVLGLGMLGCMRRAFELLAAHKGISHDLASIPAEDEATYAMIRRADTVGVFQIESRAQMAMLPRMAPKTFYDLVIEVAVVRPGPIQGDMVHPYLRRREGIEPVTYPTDALRRVLERTLGVPLFQEQAMQVAIVAAGFTPDEADQLRRAMGTFKFTAGVSKFRDKLIQGMIGNGYDQAFAERTFKQLEGFGSYGFPESHAASFALIAYASSWMKCHHPDVFCCAILNSQPMGFYAPAQLAKDARVHGVELRWLDVNKSGWDCTLEPDGERRFAVRLGFRMAREVREEDAACLVAARESGGSFSTIDELWNRTGIGAKALRRMALADAFRSLGLTRRQALWEIGRLRENQLALFAAAGAQLGVPCPEIAEEAVDLDLMTLGAEVVADYRSMGLSIRPHPLAFVREDLKRERFRPCQVLAAARNGERVRVAGLVLVRQKPGSAKGVMFATLEDESIEVANVVIWPKLFERQRRLVLTSGVMGVQGRVQRQGEVIHLVADELFDLTHLLKRIGGRDVTGEFRFTTGRGDEAKHGGSPDQREALGRARDIYIPDLTVETAKAEHLDHAEQSAAIRVRTRDFR
jgi:error-prone DNA polymerase